MPLGRLAAVSADAGVTVRLAADATVLVLASDRVLPVGPRRSLRGSVDP